MSQAWIEYANAFPGMVQTLGIRFVDADEEHIVAEMPASDASALPNGFYFGGALLSLADAVAGAVTMYEAVPPEVPSVSTAMPQLNVNIMRNSQSSLVRCEARWLRRGRNVMFAETRVTDDEGRLLMHATSTHVPIG
jgi:uncharacterized protein (TIGR00369 family)